MVRTPLSAPASDDVDSTHRFRARKSLGQHFLRDPSIARRIVRLARPATGETVVEIGPGLGALTAFLAESCERLVLVELDLHLAERAAAQYSDRATVTVVHADALAADWAALIPDRGVVIGNLPYNVATPILHRLLGQRGRIRRLVVMVQKEVAERLVARPGSRDYGALSILTQLDADAEIQFCVPPGAFSPRPRVESSVVTLDVLSHPRVALTDEERFRRLVRGVFQHRRKQLTNALRGVVAQPKELLARAGLDGRRRPETLSLEEFASLERGLDDAGVA